MAVKAFNYFNYRPGGDVWGLMARFSCGDTVVLTKVGGASWRCVASLRDAPEPVDDATGLPWYAPSFDDAFWPPAVRPYDP